MNDQLIFKFPTYQAYKKEDFYVSPSNQEAYSLIDSWPKWIKRIVNIYGPSGSGKSHLASILKSKTSTATYDVVIFNTSGSNTDGQYTVNVVASGTNNMFVLGESYTGPTLASGRFAYIT